MSEHRILIAGIGNIFFADDAFGVEVATRLVRRPLPSAVRVGDFGIRGYDLSYALLDGYEFAILIDAVPRGGDPGTLYLIEPECDERSVGTLDAHALNPVQVLRFARALGGPLPRILLVGCEPMPIDREEMQMGLSEAVEGAVDEAVDMVESLVQRLLAGEVEMLADSRDGPKAAVGKD